MPEATPKRRSAIDTLVARDQTAVFWFLAACVVGGACAWYVSLMSNALKDRPPFVVMDTRGSYYVPPGVPYSEIDAMHADLTSVFVETLLERTPEGLVYKDRIGQLCTEDVVMQIRSELLKEEKYFTAQKSYQTVVIESNKIFSRKTTAVGTIATGKVFRQSTFGGKRLDETFNFTLKIAWAENANIITNKAFPSRVEKYVLKLEKISDS